MVEEEIDIELIPTEKLIEEAKKIREAKELARQAAQLKRPLTAGISPLGIGGTEGPTLPRGAASFFESESQTRLGAIVGAKTTNDFKEFQRKQREQEKKIQDLQQRQVQLFEKILGVQLSPAGLLDIPSALAISPGRIPSRLLSTIGKFGIIGSLIAGGSSIVIDYIDDQFKRGGVFDKTLKVPAQAFTLNEIEEDNQYRSGTKYITSDLRIAQKAPEFSNTANLKFEYVRYTVENLGR